MQTAAPSDQHDVHNHNPPAVNPIHDMTSRGKSGIFIPKVFEVFGLREMTRSSLRIRPKSNNQLADAMALLRSNIIPKTTADHLPSSSTLDSDSDAQKLNRKWKRKAKERKMEILRVKEDFKQALDGSQYDLFPQSAVCKCYFFNNLGQLSINGVGDGHEKRFDDVLRRRFLRQVRLKERRRIRSCGSTRLQSLSDYNYEDEIEQLRSAADFLAELCANASSVKVIDTSFTNWAHQSVDFISAALKNLSSIGKHNEAVEGIVNGLIMRLVRRMCSTSQGDENNDVNMDYQLCIQHLIRKIGIDAYFGNRVILSVSQRIYVFAESLLFMDPFDGAFPDIHSSMYLLIQLIEFLIADYLQTWSSTEEFDTRLFEEWVVSVLNARKALELLENRVAVYILYMDRVIGELAKKVSHIQSLQKLNPEILNKLFTS